MDTLPTILKEKNVTNFEGSGNEGGKFIEHINFKDIERGEILGKGSFGTVFR